LPQVPVDAPHVPVEVPDNLQDIPNVLQEVDDKPQEHQHVPKFTFKFANAKRIANTIKGLNNTIALGMDGIPTSV
jgi:hypothetical protein